MKNPSIGLNVASRVNRTRCRVNLNDVMVFVYTKKMFDRAVIPGDVQVQYGVVSMMMNSTPEKVTERGRLSSVVKEKQW